MKNNNDIDKIFKDALDDLREAAPPAVWESLSNDLDKKQAAHFREKYYRLKRLALLLLFIVFSGSIYLFYFNTGERKKLSESQKNNSVTAANKNEPVKNTSLTSKFVTKKTAAENKNDSMLRTPENAQLSDNRRQLLPAALTGKNAADRKTNNKTTREENLRQNSSADPESVTSIQMKKATQVSSFGNNIKDNNNDHVIAGKQSRIKTDQKIIFPATAGKDNQNDFPATEKKDGQTFRYIKNKHGNRKAPVEKYQHAYDGEANETLADANGNLTSEKNKFPANEKNKRIAENKYDRSLLIQAPKHELLSSAVEPTRPLAAFASLALSDSVAANVKSAIAKAGSQKKTNSGHSFSLEIFAAPNHSFTRLEDGQQLSGPGQDKNEARKAEQQGSSFSAGVLVNYGLNKKWIVQSGIVFSSAKTNIAAKTIYAKPDNNGHPQFEFNCSSGYSFITPKSGNPPAIGDSIRTMPSSSTINYIGVPVSLNYVLQKGKFLFEPGIGLSVNFLTSGNSSTNFSNTTGKQKETTTITGLKTTYLDGSLGFGASYRLSRKISVGLKPLMRLALTAINKNTPVKTYQNYLSLEASLKINL